MLTPQRIAAMRADANKQDVNQHFSDETVEELLDVIESLQHSLDTMAGAIDRVRGERDSIRQQREAETKRAERLQHDVDRLRAQVDELLMTDLTISKATSRAEKAEALAARLQRDLDFARDIARLVDSGREESVGGAVTTGAETYRDLPLSMTTGGVARESSDVVDGSEAKP